MVPEPMVVGGCTFNRWRYATWPFVSAGVEDRGFRVAARIWPIVLFGFLDVDRSLVEFSRQDRSVLIPWKAIRSVELRRSNEVELILADGWRLRFGTPSEPLGWLVGHVGVRLTGA